MTTTEAIKQLQTEHDLIAQERDLDGSQFAPALLGALAMAIEVMQGDGDTISRQAALAETVHMELFGRDFPVVPVGVLKALPSAQPETHGKRTEMHACDCVSRQAAIEAEDSK